jgi:hypothetical protein
MCLSGCKDGNADGEKAYSEFVACGVSICPHVCGPDAGDGGDAGDAG